MRDIIKQSALLEDHMYQPEKRCKDCIRKHFLTIEGLAEECATLCKPHAILPEARSVARTARVLHHAWEQAPKNSRLTEHVAGRLRVMRKRLMKQYAALPLNKLPSRETAQVTRLLERIRGPKKTRQWKIR